MTRRAMSLLPALCAGAACSGSVNQSVLEPNGPGAEAVTAFWWFALALAGAVYAVTIGALLWAGWRARQREQRGELRAADEERRMTRGVTI